MLALYKSRTPSVPLLRVTFGIGISDVFSTISLLYPLSHRGHLTSWEIHLCTICNQNSMYISES